MTTRFPNAIITATGAIISAYNQHVYWKPAGDCDDKRKNDRNRPGEELKFVFVNRNAGNGFLDSSTAWGFYKHRVTQNGERAWEKGFKDYFHEVTVFNPQQDSFCPVI